MKVVRLSRALGFGLLVLPCVLVLAACAPQGDASSDEAAATAEGGAPDAPSADMAAADPATAGALACTWTDAGAELTGRASPPDSTEVQLGDGVAKVCYSAPSMRGRQIFGGLEPWGEPWRLGANEPTTLHVTVPAEIGTVTVEPGSYSLYAIPGETEWTIVVNRAVDRWGIPIDESVRSQDVGSFTVAPSATDPIERLLINLAPADAGAAEMVVGWENTRLTFPVRAAATGG
ncbi:MAG: DUF2911 domain-containing protein [Longimicrobiales bacterium]